MKASDSYLSPPTFPLLSLTSITWSLLWKPTHLQFLSEDSVAAFPLLCPQDPTVLPSDSATARQAKH